MQDIPEDQREILERIAGPSYYGVRIPTDQTREIILQVCKGRHLTAEQLAELLNRHPHSLRARFLNPMVAEGVLRRQASGGAQDDGHAYTAAGPAA